MRTKLKLEHESQLQENEKNFLNLQNNISRLKSGKNLTRAKKEKINLLNIYLTLIKRARP